MKTEIIAVIISGISLILALVSFIFSIISKIKSSSIALENTRLANGMLELEGRTAIREENARVNEVGMKISPLIEKNKRDELSQDQKTELEFLVKNMKAAEQGMLNAYEEACSKYIDNKIDRTRFRKTYQFEIRNLLESTGLKQYFDTHTSRYRAIIKVYNDWENLER